jgi:acyl carrier protein
MDPRTRIVDELRSIVAELSEGGVTADAVDTAAPLFDFGYVDSLTAVVLIERVRTRWGVEISEIDLVGRLHTLDALGEFVAAHGDGSA